MKQAQRIDRVALARAEAAAATLGDARRTKRLGHIVESLAVRPAESLPDALGGEAALEGAYRFLGNKKVRPEAILAPHIEQTQRRCAQQELVLAVFDTTELRFGGEREGLGYLSHEKGRGLLAHIGLALNAATREPLGVLHCETVVRRGAMKRRKQAFGAPDSESLRWQRGVDAAWEQTPDGICVMDREADIFTLVDSMQGRGQRFVIRAAQNRATDEGPLWNLLDDTELVTTRVVELAERRSRKRKSERRLHPPRSGHAATLEIRARPVTLRSPNSARSATARTVEVNLVHVVERDPPPGDAAVEWILLTNLPIATSKDVDLVVDAYRARWVIEEFFKALKSGCAIEKRQLESVHSITNLLAVSLPIAWLLLRLRHLSRDTPDQSAATVLSPPTMTCLRVLYEEHTGHHLPTRPTCRELNWAVAALGGHIKNNGEPGFIVLGRGLARLLEAGAVVTAFKNAGKM